MARDQDVEDVLQQQPQDDDLGVREYLTSFRDALVAGDCDAIAALVEAPAFILSHDVARPIEAVEEVAELVSGARKQYGEIGITGTRAEIIRVDEITDRMVMVRVRWPYLDAYGREMGAETATYALVRPPKGDWRLRVAILHGQEAVN